MTETAQQQFRRLGRHILVENLRRAFRACILLRPFINLFTALRTRSIIHPLAWIDGNVKIGRRCMIGKAHIDTLGGYGRIEIGDGTIIYTHSELIAHPGSTLRIGRNVLFTRGAGAVTGGHNFADPEASIISQGTVVKDITIGDDCWIGYRAIVLPGADVGSGSVVAAGAVVHGPLPPMSIAAGVPAKVIRSRLKQP